nr:uncharacterized protein LOC129136861 [Pan troglodytes]
MAFHYVAQAGLKLLESSKSPALASQSAGITGAQRVLNGHWQKFLEKQPSLLLESLPPLSLPASLSVKRLFRLELRGPVWTTCGTNTPVTMDTLLLAIRCYFRHCWTDGLCSERGRVEMFYRACQLTAHKMCSAAFPGWGLNWGRRLLDTEKWFLPWRLLCGLWAWASLWGSGFPPGPPHSPRLCLVLGMCLQLGGCWTQDIHSRTDTAQ